MAVTKLVLDRQAVAQTFQFGDSGAGEEALVTLEAGGDATNLVLDVKGAADFDGDVGIGGDLNLTGDLNIIGSVNAQSVTNLEVSDLTVTLNKGGATPSDDTAGVLVEGTSGATKGAIYYNAASATKFTIGDGTTQADIVDRTSAQTLTNKTLTSPVLTSPALGTPSSGTLTNATGLPISGLVASTSTALGVGTVELGHASDTTLSRSSAGVLAVEGVVVPTISSTSTLTNKTLTSPVLNTGVSGTAVLDEDDMVSDSATKLATQQSIKAYVDAAVSGAGGSPHDEIAVSGTQDSANKGFTLASAITYGEQIFLNGQLLTEGSSNDYTITGTTLSFATGFTAPAATDVIRAFGS